MEEGMLPSILFPQLFEGHSKKMQTLNGASISCFEMLFLG
jgi:hypothetical protein